METKIFQSTLTLTVTLPKPQLPRHTLHRQSIRIRATTNKDDAPPPSSTPPPPVRPPETVQLRFRRRSKKRRQAMREKDEMERKAFMEAKKEAEPKSWEEMDWREKAIELYVGEKGLLFWLNKFAYASIFIVIGAWILFRFVGPSLNLYQLESAPLSPTSLFKGS